MSNSEFCDLEEITSGRYFDVTLDSKLNFNAHVDKITKKATKLLNLCRKTALQSTIFFVFNDRFVMFLLLFRSSQICNSDWGNLTSLCSHAGI